MSIEQTKGLVKLLKSENNESLKLANTIQHNIELDLPTLIEANLRFQLEVVTNSGSTKRGYYKYSEKWKRRFIYRAKKRNSNNSQLVWDKDLPIKVKKIIIPKEYIQTPREAAKELANKIHPKLWQNLKAELLAYSEGKEPAPSIIYNNGANLRYKTVKSIFPKKRFAWSGLQDSIVNNIEKAIESGIQYRDSWPADTSHRFARDLSIEVTDGRAWFNSEYAGCANGDYWLLIAPNLVVFYCTD